MRPNCYYECSCGDRCMARVVAMTGDKAYCDYHWRKHIATEEAKDVKRIDDKG